MSSLKYNPLPLLPLRLVDRREGINTNKTNNSTYPCDSHQERYEALVQCCTNISYPFVRSLQTECFFIPPGLLLRFFEECHSLCISFPAALVRKQIQYGPVCDTVRTFMPYSTDLYPTPSTGTSGRGSRKRVNKCLPHYFQPRAVWGICNVFILTSKEVQE